MNTFTNLILFSICFIYISDVSCDRGAQILFKKSNKRARNKKLKGVYLNKWAVVIHGDDGMAKKVADENGFINRGKVFSNIYEFEHKGIPRRKKRASFVKTMHLKMDTRVVWAQQQESKVRKARSITFNDAKWKEQWYLHRTEPGFEGHDMNVIPVWERGITGKGIVISVLDDGIEYNHPELRDNYDPKASYDYNDHDPDPMPRYTWRDDNRHGTRCAGEIAAAGNNSNCIVGVAYGSSIGGIRMLDGEITDLVEAQSLRHARDHIDIYSISWGPEDDGMTVDGPGTITKRALEEGAKYGRHGKGSIIVWASGNGGSNDHCNCDGYTNSIYTISVSAASSIGYPPWYLESCASTLVAAYSSGETKSHKHIITSDLSSGCTDRHTGTSVSPPLVAGFIALALEVNPNLSWRDVQHLLVETSRLDYLKGNDFQTNGAGKRFSHHFGFGVINGDALVSLAERWLSVGEQKVCHHRKEIKKFPYNRFNKSTPLVIEIDVSTCKGSPQLIKYLEHVQIRTTFYHYRRGKSEIRIESPMKTQSWVLRERKKDYRGGEFSNWKFLTNHFWGENPNGIWRITFFSKQRDEYGQGFLQDITLILFGTEHKPGVAKDNDVVKKPYKCHQECKMGCTGTENNDCKKCQRYRYIGNDSKTYCVPYCPSHMYTTEGSMLCLPCHPTCLTCQNGNRTHCLSCPTTLSHLNGACVEECTTGMYREIDVDRPDNYVCKPCSDSCVTCELGRDRCTSCASDAILQDHECKPKCSSSEWFDGQECQVCHATCKTCNGASQFNCTSCSRKILNDAEDRYLYKFSECLLGCPFGTFKENSLMENCLDCPENCLVCSNEGRTCEKCKVSHYRMNTADGSCVKVCPSGFYADVLRRVCEPCNALCSSCVPGKPSACTSCSNGYYLKDHDCVSSNECNTRYYVNTTSGRCSFCPEACDSCDSASRCYSCFFNYFLTPSGKCEEKCPDGSYALERATICEKCDETCAKCDGPSPQDCIACAKGKTLQNGRCREEIIQNRHFVTVVDGVSTARFCHHTCKTCDGPEANNCLTCIHRSLDLRSDECINPCLNQYLSENNCQNCHPSCKSCFGSKLDECLECHENFTLNTDTFTCNKVCHRRYYKDASTNVCKKCHPSCASCFGPKADQCTSCPDKLHFYKNENRCVIQCPPGWYKTFGQQCTPCSSSCGKCVYKYDFCTHCPPGQVWDNYKCFKSCGLKKFHNVTSDRRRCLPCHETCLQCNGTAPNQCKACEPGSTLIDGMCIKGCLIGFYNQSSTGLCKACTKDCLKCKALDGNKTQCIVCSNSTFLQPNGECLQRCPTGYYQIPIDNVCKPCPGKGCAKCDSDGGKTCEACKPMYDLSKGLCKTTCGVGKYPDEEKQVCTACHPLCYSCDGPSKMRCTRCNKNALMMISSDKAITCTKSCPVGFYSTLKVCLACNTSCSSCANQFKCTSCHPPLALHKYKCVTTCPNGFFLNEVENACVSCRHLYGSCSSCDMSGCKTCMPGAQLNGKVCSFQCGDGYVKSNKKCVACSALHESCSQCSLTKCTECQIGYQLKDDVCVEKCEPGFVLIDGLCVDEELLPTTKTMTSRQPTTTDDDLTTTTNVEEAIITDTVDVVTTVEPTLTTEQQQQQNTTVSMLNNSTTSQKPTNTPTKDDLSTTRTPTTTTATTATTIVEKTVTTTNNDTLYDDKLTTTIGTTNNTSHNNNYTDDFVSSGDEMWNVDDTENDDDDDDDAEKRFIVVHKRVSSDGVEIDTISTEPVNLTDVVVVQANQQPGRSRRAVEDYEAIARKVHESTSVLTNLNLFVIASVVLVACTVIFSFTITVRRRKHNTLNKNNLTAVKT